MGRPAIPDSQKKRTVSMTLTPEQCLLLRWSAAETGTSTSVFIGQLIEREAKRIAKQKDKKLPNMDQNQLQWTADGQAKAMADIRNLCGGRKRAKVVKKSS